MVNESIDAAELERRIATPVVRMSPIVAVKTYLEKDTQTGHVSLVDFRDFWESLSETARLEYAQEAAKVLGVELDLKT